jgi:hypothetical protein
VENTTEDLPYTPLECEWGRPNLERASPTAATGAHSHPDSYLQLLKQVQALLSSHHATSRTDDPLNSHLVLAEEQKVTLRDLLSPLWRFPELSEVFLSCCETGLSFASFRIKRETCDRNYWTNPSAWVQAFCWGALVL